MPQVQGLAGRPLHQRRRTPWRKLQQLIHNRAPRCPSLKFQLDQYIKPIAGNWRVAILSGWVSQRYRVGEHRQVLLHIFGGTLCCPALQLSRNYHWLVQSSPASRQDSHLKKRNLLANARINKEQGRPCSPSSHPRAGETSILAVQKQHWRAYWGVQELVLGALLKRHKKHLSNLTGESLRLEFSHVCQSELGPYLQRIREERQPHRG